MVPICLGNGFKTSSKADGMFYLNPPLGKGPVESNVFGGTRLTSGLTPWGGRQPGGMEFLDADICQVTGCPHASR
jgi:hypothetical protein